MTNKLFLFSLQMICEGNAADLVQMDCRKIMLGDLKLLYMVILFLAIFIGTGLLE